MTFNDKQGIILFAVHPVRARNRKHIFVKQSGGQRIEATLRWDEEKYDYVIDCCERTYESNLSSDNVVDWLINNGFIDARSGKYDYRVEE